MGVVTEMRRQDFDKRVAQLDDCSFCVPCASVPFRLRNSTYRISDLLELPFHHVPFEGSTTESGDFQLDYAAEYLSENSCGTQHNTNTHLGQATTFEISWRLPIMIWIGKPPHSW